MNKFYAFLALSALLVAPGCRNFGWRQPAPQPKVVKAKKKTVERKSGPQGWNINMDKE